MNPLPESVGGASSNSPQKSPWTRGSEASIVTLNLGVCVMGQ